MNLFPERVVQPAVHIVLAVCAWRRCFKISITFLFPFHLFFFATWCIFILFALTVLFLLVCSPPLLLLHLLGSRWAIHSVRMHIHFSLYWISSVFRTWCVVLSLLIHFFFSCLTHWSTANVFILFLLVDTFYSCHSMHCVIVLNTLRAGSFKLFKRPFPGFLTILTL